MVMIFNSFLHALAALHLHPTPTTFSATHKQIVILASPRGTTAWPTKSMCVFHFSLACPRSHKSRSINSLPLSQFALRALPNQPITASLDARARESAPVFLSALARFVLAPFDDFPQQLRRRSSRRKISC